MKINFKLLLLFIFCSGRFISQNLFLSESIIKYDIKTHKTDKPIPFDRPFTLSLEKISAKGILKVYAFEVKVKNGIRQPKIDKGTIAIHDFVVQHNKDSDTLNLYFPAIKPNVDFEIYILRQPSIENKAKLFEINKLLYKDVVSTDDFKTADTLFRRFRVSLSDKITDINAMGHITLETYKIFYDKKLKSNFAFLADLKNFKYNATISLRDLEVVDTLSSTEKNDFSTAYYLAEAINQKQLDKIQTGELNIYKIFQKGNPTELIDGTNRILNIDANIKYFDSLQRRVDRIISRNLASVKVSGLSTNLTAIWENVNTFRSNLSENSKLIKKKQNFIDKSINENDSIKEVVALVANTLSSDLKTAGGNLFFLDAGLADIFAPGLNEKVTHLPKLYWGASIYFKPIDKNTRRNRFPSKCGLKCNDTTGADFSIVAKQNILHHLCLNVGITLGPMVNKDYGNLYNNNSLLVGPAIRFARAFKISAGASFMRRTSKNPMISEKGIVCGGYASLSVDIDFIQGVKDITAILFK